MDTEGKKPKHVKNKKQTNKVSQNDIIKSPDDLELQYPDLIDETTIGTFPGKNTVIMLMPQFHPNAQHLDQFQSTNKHNLKLNSTKC